MKLNKFKCDGCDKATETKQPVPQGWLEFWVLEMPHTIPHIHACSRACAEKTAAHIAGELYDRVGR